MSDALYAVDALMRGSADGRIPRHQHARPHSAPRSAGSILLLALLALSTTSCDLWPTNLKPLAESLTQQVGGEVSAWLVGGDVVVVAIAHSPLFTTPEDELAAIATDIAVQAAAFPSALVASLSISFHENELSEVEDEKREFIFVMRKGAPKLIGSEVILVTP